MSSVPLVAALQPALLATQVVKSNQIMNMVAGVFAALSLGLLTAGSMLCVTGVGAVMGAPIILISVAFGAAAGYLSYHTHKIAQTPEPELPNQLTKSAQIMNIVAGVFAAMGAFAVLTGFSFCATGIGAPLGVPVILIGSLFLGAAGYIAYQARQLKG